MRMKPLFFFFFLNPAGNKVLDEKGQKSVYQRVNSDEKECITTLVIGSASGVVGPTMVVHSYARIPADIADSTPPAWALDKSELG